MIDRPYIVTWAGTADHMTLFDPGEVAWISTDCGKSVSAGHTPRGQRVHIRGRAPDVLPTCGQCKRAWLKWKDRMQERAIVTSFLAGESMIRLAIEYDMPVLDIEKPIREAFRDQESDLW